MQGGKKPAGGAAIPQHAKHPSRLPARPPFGGVESVTQQDIQRGLTVNAGQDLGNRPAGLHRKSAKRLNEQSVSSEGTTVKGIKAGTDQRESVPGGLPHLVDGVAQGIQQGGDAFMTANESEGLNGTATLAGGESATPVAGFLTGMGRDDLDQLSGVGRSLPKAKYMLKDSLEFGLVGRIQDGLNTPNIHSGTAQAA